MKPLRRIHPGRAVTKSRYLQKFVPEIPFSVMKGKIGGQKKLFLLTSQGPSAILNERGVLAISQEGYRICKKKVERI